MEDQFPKIESSFMHDKLLSSGFYGILSSSTPPQLLGVPIILEGMKSSLPPSSPGYFVPHDDLTSSIQSPIASVPWNFLESFPQLTQFQYQHPDQHSKAPNPTLFLKEPKVLELSQSNNNMNPYIPNSLHQSAQTRNEWVEINKNPNNLSLKRLWILLAKHHQDSAHEVKNKKSCSNYTNKAI